MKRTVLLVAAMLVFACGGGDTVASTIPAPSATTSLPEEAITTTPPASGGGGRYGYGEPGLEGTTTSAAGNATSTTPATTTSVTGTTVPTGTTVTVSVASFEFSPATVTIKVGDTVRWNLTEASHTSTSGTPLYPDGLWNKVLGPDPFTRTFSTAGTYSYFCRFHPDAMQGTVIVNP